MKAKRNYVAFVLLMLAFLALLAAVLKVDVKPIGPEGSSIGLATLNGYVKDTVGVSLIWYQVTEYLGYLSLAVVPAFGLFGLIQLIRRRSFLKVDTDLYILALFYGLVAGTYVFFEKVIINYRPVILDEGLEASFPSSHSMLVVAIMGTAAYQLASRVKNDGLRIFLVVLCWVIAMTTVIGRLLSGVHWFTDIIAGAVLADAYVMLYVAVVRSLKMRKRD